MVEPANLSIEPETPEPTVILPPVSLVIPPPIPVSLPPFEVPPPIPTFAVKEKKEPIVFYVLAGILIVAGLTFSAITLIKNKNSQNQAVVIPTLIPKPTVSVPTPTPDPTANWKVYTNENMNITFKIPSSWLERENPAKGTPIFEDSDSKMWVDIYYLGTIGGISGIQTLDSYCNSQHKYDSELTKHNIEISNLPAVYCVNEDNRDSTLPSVLFMVQNGNKQYELSAGFNKEGFQNYLNIFLQILSTFKFLDLTGN